MLVKVTVQGLFLVEMQFRQGIQAYQLVLDFVGARVGCGLGEILVHTRQQMDQPEHFPVGMAERREGIFTPPPM